MLKINKVLRMRNLLVLLSFAAANLLCTFTLSAAPTGRTATYVVAASDAPAHVKTQADYVCDGIADDVEIQAAINALSAGGGKIVLSEGIFMITATVNITGNYIKLVGQGISTQMKRTNNSAVDLLSISGISDAVEDVFLHGNRIGGDGNTTNDALVITGASRLRLRGVDIHYAPRNGIFANNGTDKTEFFFTDVELLANGSNAADLIRVAGVFVEGGYFGTSVTNHGLQLSFCVEHYYSNCAFDSNNRIGAHVSSSQKINIVNSYFGGNLAQNYIWDGNYEAGDSYGNVLLGNTFNDCGSNSYDASIYISPTTTNHDLMIVNNWFKNSGVLRQGIQMVGSINNAVIVGNNLRQVTIPFDLGSLTGTDNIIRQNMGYVTEKSGTATVASGQTTVNVTHGLASTPARVLLTPTITTGGRYYWISAKSATTFTIRINSTYTSAITFDWRATVGEE